MLMKLFMEFGGFNAFYYIRTKVHCKCRISEVGLSFSTAKICTMYYGTSSVILFESATHG